MAGSLQMVSALKRKRVLPISNRLALGTVQFGLPYGIANQTGQVSRDEVATILDHAWAMGFDTLDSASDYGESEQRLGEIGVAKWRVVSKLPALLQESCEDVAGWAQDSVIKSLERLKISRLQGLLVHRSPQLLGRHGEALLTALDGLKSQGLVAKIGVSIYGPQELDAIWPYFHPDLVQAPFNVVDRRLLTSGWLSRLHGAGTEVHVRSVFLQGLLLMDPARRPTTFNRWQALWRQWDRWLADQSVTPLQACLEFSGSQPEISRLVIGVDNLKQLEEITPAIKHSGLQPPMELSCEDRDLVEPSRWTIEQ